MSGGGLPNGATGTGLETGAGLEELLARLEEATGAGLEGARGARLELREDAGGREGATGRGGGIKPKKIFTRGPPWEEAGGLEVAKGAPEAATISSACGPT